MNRFITEEERTAVNMLRNTGVSPIDAAALLRELLSATKGNMQKARDCIREGIKQLQQQSQSVSFSHAVKVALQCRKDRRPRTIVDFRYITNRLMRRNPELATRKIRTLSSAECTVYLHRAFETPQQFRKARAILSGVFSTAFRMGWCDANPILRVEVPRIREKTIHPLKSEEITRLETTVKQPEHEDMALSLHLLLYCGVRPHEVARMNPQEDIDWESQEVYIRPTTSKTGGGRVIPLRKISSILHSNRCIPRNWEKRWRALRRAARFEHWQQDACRHTFATYHARCFRNLPALQLEMGHGSLRLLQTRYIMACRVQAPEEFWRSTT